MILGYLHTAVAFAIVLGVLVSVHECGHYIAARWCGVIVEVFSIGFGPALFQRRDRHGTLWKIAAIPLGGFVKMKGWADFGGVAGGDAEAGSFRGRPLGARALIVAAGPIANMILAFVLFTGLVATIGVTTVEPVVSRVLPNTPAAAAGLKSGDRIVIIDGKSIRSFEAIREIVQRSGGNKLSVVIEDRTGLHHVILIPKVAVVGGKIIGEIGIVGADVSHRPVSLAAALFYGADQTWRVTGATIAGLWQLVTGHESVRHLGGPVRIAELSGQAASLGVAEFVSFIAILSVNLGLLNLVPIPVLDGGHLLFYAFEAVARRPLPRTVQEIGLMVGAALLASLILFVTWNELGIPSPIHIISALRP